MAEEALLPGQSTASASKLPRTTHFWSVVNRAVDFSYQGLKHLWVLLLTTAIVVGLLAGAFWLPQLPGQLVGDPTAAARWLLGVSSSYGTVGGLLRTLGMFNALYSPLLQLALAVLALILCLYLSDWLVIAWRFYRLPALLASRAQPVGAPLKTVLPLIIYRQRQAVPAAPEALQEQIQRYLHEKFSQVQPARLEFSAEPASQTGEEMAEDADTGQEWRLLATRYLPWLYLRPLGIIGALLALSGVWWMVIAGWWIAPPLLAPGDLYRYAQRNLELNYVVEAQTTTPLLAAKLAAHQARQPVMQPTRIWLGQVEVKAQPGPPALLVRTSKGEATLERAGQSKAATLLGLVFPSIGNEESIVLRQQAVGLRIVRTAAATPTGDLSGFLVELYRGKDARPEPIAMGKTQRQAIPIDKQVTLELTLLPSLAVTASYLPGRWLLGVALLLGVIGGVGFARRPAFLLLQIGPWPDLRSVVVAQSNVPAEIEMLQGFLNANDATTPP